MKVVNFTIGISLLLSGCSEINQKSINKDSYKPSSNKIERVVTLTSLSTDIVSSISNNKLVAIPGSSLFKDKIDYQNLPRISQGRTPPNLEKIVSLKPDLVIGTKGFHDKILGKLKDINIKTLSYELIDWKTLENTINIISSKLDINSLEKSNEIINTNLKECVVANEPNKKPNVVVLASLKPILSPNSKSWAGNLLKRYGLNSLTEDLSSKSEFRGYVNLSPEWLVKEDPDNLIIIQTRPGQYADFETTNPFSNLTAVKSNQVYRFNYYGLINAGSLESINNACLQLRKIF
ncbi:ABC transporter substrate-binding protein [Prochlorococcus marinus]|uniref:ABC transporter substrate-binding protein n=1 Tax=Prochlorococcus marinus TaxID=1219 RepID=UPI0022B55D7B|nr:ABC transporter substrate-binding protein [Prochlorococcus marinus]